jgi:hypothetical protein
MLMVVRAYFLGCFWFFLLIFCSTGISPLYLKFSVFSNALLAAIQALLLNKSSLELGVAFFVWRFLTRVSRFSSIFLQQLQRHGLVCAAPSPPFWATISRD